MSLNLRILSCSLSKRMTVIDLLAMGDVISIWNYLVLYLIGVWKEYYCTLVFASDIINGDPNFQIFIFQPQSLQYVGDIPRSNFQFDFDFERKILAEAEKENPNWGRVMMENLPLRTAEPVPTPVSY